MVALAGGGAKGQVEVGQQRSAIAVEQDVGRLDVAVEDAAAGAREPAPRPPCSDPASRLDEIAAGQTFAVAQGGRVEHGLVTAEPVHGVEDGLTVPLRPFALAQFAQDVFEVGAGHELHAQQPQPASAVHLFGIDGNDVLVFETGQRPRLAVVADADLEGHLSPSESCTAR